MRITLAYLAGLPAFCAGRFFLNKNIKAFSAIYSAEPWPPWFLPAFGLCILFVYPQCCLPADDRSIFRVYVRQITEDRRSLTGMEGAYGSLSDREKFEIPLNLLFLDHWRHPVHPFFKEIGNCLSMYHLFLPGHFPRLVHKQVYQGSISAAIGTGFCSS